MHACGHDVHTAMLLGAAKYFSEHPHPNNAGIRLVFQHAEEMPPGGAPELISAQVMDGIEQVFSLHLLVTAPTGTLQLRAGAILANSDGFDIDIRGQGGHGAEPEGTIDALLVASEMVTTLHHVVSRMTSPFDPVAITVGKISSGTARNVIAEHASIAGTVRTLSAKTQETLRQKIQDIAEGIAKAYGATVTFSYDRGYPVVINDARVVQQLTEELQTPGLLGVGPGEQIKLAGDDFAYFLQKAPGAYGFLGCRPDGDHIGDHHAPNFTVDEACLKLGTMALIQAALYYQ